MAVIIWLANLNFWRLTSRDVMFMFLFDNFKRSTSITSMRIIKTTPNTVTQILNVISHYFRKERNVYLQWVRVLFISIRFQAISEYTIYYRKIMWKSVLIGHNMFWNCWMNLIFFSDTYDCNCGSLLYNFLHYWNSFMRMKHRVCIYITTPFSNLAIIVTHPKTFK